MCCIWARSTVRSRRRICSITPRTPFYLAHDQFRRAADKFPGVARPHKAIMMDWKTGVPPGHENIQTRSLLLVIAEWIILFTEHNGPGTVCPVAKLFDQVPYVFMIEGAH